MTASNRASLRGKNAVSCSPSIKILFLRYGWKDKMEFTFSTQALNSSAKPPVSISSLRIWIDTWGIYFCFLFPGYWKSFSCSHSASHSCQHSHCPSLIRQGLPASADVPVDCGFLEYTVIPSLKIIALENMTLRKKNLTTVLFPHFQNQGLLLS